MIHTLFPNLRAPNLRAIAILGVMYHQSVPLPPAVPRPRRANRCAPRHRVSRITIAAIRRCCRPAKTPPRIAVVIKRRTSVAHDR